MKKFVLCVGVVLLVAFLLMIAQWVLAWLLFPKYQKPNDYQQYFAEHEQRLTRYAHEFLHQGNITWVIRLKGIHKIGYSVKCKNGEGNGFDARITVYAPYEEMEFWEQADVKAMKGDPATSDAETMGEFFKKYGITEEEFLKWRAFLAEYDLYSINIEKEDPFVRLLLTPSEEHALVYKDDQGISFGEENAYSKVLSEHWLYLDGDGGLNGEAPPDEPFSSKEDYSF